ncbi:unnamed protein product [Owenia fusiformis]|uniref:Glutaredoxin-2, mitochondrial n=1 Tax=Owenia fusiformis TaxID=6347 RepID=A0A8S4NWX8_OWEFU|nr:unnamed protein product [Owenia fusiformis]
MNSLRTLVKCTGSSLLRVSQRNIMGSLFSSDTGSSNPELEQFVKEKINGNCVMVFSKTTCGFCRMAKETLNNAGATYEALEINNRPDAYEIQSILGKMTGSTTVPRVFINGKCIGGGSETKSLHNAGKLIPMIEDCGIKASL